MSMSAKVREYESYFSLFYHFDELACLMNFFGSIMIKFN